MGQNALKQAKKGLRINLTTKIFLLFFIIPITIMAVSGYLYFNQVGKMSSLITNKSLDLATKMAEREIAEKGRSVAAQVKLYLDGHPDLKKEDFFKDEEFRKIASQPVGKTGYTTLSSVEPNGVLIIWVHPTAGSLIGTDLMPIIDKTLGDQAYRFKNILQIFNGKTAENMPESSGYYPWPDANKVMREKYQYDAPVKGTNFVIASVTYIDEFMDPIVSLKNDANAIANNIKKILLGLIVVSILLIAIIVFAYSSSLKRKINALSKYVKDINDGNLDSELTLESNDELGDLGNTLTMLVGAIKFLKKDKGGN